MSGTAEAAGTAGLAVAAAAVRCGYCGGMFTPNPAQAACRACPLSAGCRYVRCPSCGYENPVEPRWLGVLRRLVAR